MEQLTWGILLAAYLFVGGMAGGAFIVGALADILGKDKWKVLSKSGIYVSLPCIIFGLVFLILDLGRFEVAPLSPLNAYINFPASIMSVGTWIITAFTAVSLVTAILYFFEGHAIIRKLFEVVGFVLGGSTAAYTGVLLSFARGRPFWVSPYLPWLFIISGTLTGLAMALFLIPIIAVFMPRFFEDFKNLFDKRTEYVSMLGETDKYLTILGIIEICLIVLFIGTAPGGSFLMTGPLSLWFYAYLILGLIAPLGIGYYIAKLDSARAHENLKTEGISSSMVLSSLGSFVLILIGGFLLRYVVLVAGQIII
ncbi:hypothetical protein AC482_00270 [miscellaneous Crenarchaeota group-15 archaeon DG-45]|uniref:Polysulfide reductase n=1 Tax=miscellaneous Crenarchaeota group-15 archaeon DG-45 TaxID=1685127 RepID=A0A0M0BSY1_9ARCH|nr:MAG: hypothetical protein AC482_00270 [miscellaneous Crenarchaeota group-15 archaeon DG-45]